MLVLSRHAGERIVIGDDIVITFLGMRNGQGRIGVVAPPHVAVDRQEIADAKRNERKTLD